jgi:hypothetical protein
MNGNGHGELNDIRAVLGQIAASQARQEHILGQHTDWLKDHDRLLTEHATLLNALAESQAALGENQTAFAKNQAAFAENQAALAANLRILAENGVRLDTRINALVSICDDLIRNKRDRKKRSGS